MYAVMSNEFMYNAAGHAANVAQACNMERKKTFPYLKKFVGGWVEAGDYYAQYLKNRTKLEQQLNAQYSGQLMVGPCVDAIDQLGTMLERVIVPLETFSTLRDAFENIQALNRELIDTAEHHLYSDMLPAFREVSARTTTLCKNAVLWEKALTLLVDDAADLADAQWAFYGRFGDNKFGPYATPVTGSPLAKEMRELDRRHINLDQLQKTAATCGQETAAALDAVIAAYADLSGRSQAVVTRYYAMRGLTP